MSNLAKTSQTSSDAAILALSLERGAGEPLSVQLLEGLRRMILSRRIEPGARLPASRVLAQELSISRATVTLAVEQLISEGYAEGRHGSGVYVTADLPDHVLQADSPDAAKPAKIALREPEPVRPFQVAAADLSMFPHAEWAKLLDRVWRAPQPALLANPDPCGWAPLRQAIAGHLAAWRGISCDAAQIVITSGANEAADLLGRSLFRTGDRILMEDPGYHVMRRAFEAAGLHSTAIPVDAHGFDIKRAETEVPAARGALVTPSRQYPLGMTMPLQRRLELLEWAASSGGIVIEDDYDSEYRYQGRPLPALMGLDEHDCVVYAGSFSKVLSKTLRLGFLVLPHKHITAITRALADTGPQAALLAQPALARFIGSGSFASHIRRMRRAYAKRQQVLLAAAAVHLDGLLDLEPAPSGMHVLARLTPALARRMTDVEASALAEAVGITASSLSAFYTGRTPRQALLLGYAGFDQAAIEEAVCTLATCLRPA